MGKHVWESVPTEIETYLPGQPIDLSTLQLFDRCKFCFKRRTIEIENDECDRSGLTDSSSNELDSEPPTS